MIDEASRVPPMPYQVVVCAEHGHVWPDNDPEPFGYGDIVAFLCDRCAQWVTKW